MYVKTLKKKSGITTFTLQLEGKEFFAFAKLYDTRVFWMVARVLLCGCLGVVHPKMFTPSLKDASYF